MSKRGTSNYARALAVGIAAVASFAFAGPASATPVATGDPQYQGLGRVFPDPLATCSHVGAEPCSPNAQGNVPATQFIQFEEFIDALEYMNQRPAAGENDPAWSRFMEVLILDGEFGDNHPGGGPADNRLDVGDVPGNDMFVGNDQPLEFDPKPQYRSAGLPRSDLGRQRSDLVTIRVTDESVPDAGKERYALSLGIHGIERAGVEGGTRAAEDLITAFTTGKADEPVVPESADPDAPTFAEVLRETIIYFTYPNPDGWRRGSIVDGANLPGVFYQRYNGNGVDLNRDWPDIGFTFRPYSGLSEPESRAFADYFTGVEESTNSEFAAGDDLHGQPFADALSFTLLPHGRHDFEKNERIRDTATTIHRASEEALVWSPLVKPNEPDGVPRENSSPCAPTVALGPACTQIYGQTWGTVYDTINYTTTGALGDWFDSSIGLGADGIDNEMSFSHLDRNIVFDPHTEQLHVDGNKALIYAHLATILAPPESSFDAPGTKGYVANTRLEREEKSFQSEAPPNTRAQDDVEGQTATIGTDGRTVFPIEVKRTEPTPTEPGIYNGGMRVDVTTPNLQGVATGTANLRLQCRACDQHVGVPHSDEWITVAEDYNQSLIYLQSGVTVAVNRPQATAPSGEPIEWRAVLDGGVFTNEFTDENGEPTNPAPVSKMNVDYTSEPATIDGSTGGDEPPRLAGYDVANTDFFGSLNPHIPGEGNDFREIDPRAVIGGSQSLDGFDSLVLADDPLPGYTGNYGESTVPTGPPTPDFTFEGTLSVPGASSGLPGTFEEFPFTVGANDLNGKTTVRIDWEQQVNDFDMFLYRVEENGDRTQIGSSTGTQGETDWEEIVINDGLAPGEYVVVVDNWAAADPRYQGSVTFDPPAGGAGTGEDVETGAYTLAEKDAWMAALREWVDGGGNLVLTDGALRALPDLTEVPTAAVRRQTVYAGQTAFATGEGEDTLADPLADDVDQEGARFNSGMRRQTFEPTPLGFAIQDAGGSDQSNSRQYDVDKEAWEAAGGRTAGTSVDAGDRDAQAVYERVTLGELGVGDGQIRIAGALLPQASQEFDHTLGLEPYATTYTGYILMRNLLEVEPDGTTPSSGGDGSGDTGTGGDGSGGPGSVPNTKNPAPGPRCEKGSAKKDSMRGGPEDDCLKGRGGKDRLRGGRGDDVLSGGRGNDWLSGGPGSDRIACGAGRDVARADSRDRLTGCEKVG